MTIHIIGAGMAGLLAANMLHHRNPIVHEVQPALPNNHSAVLRFRSPIVGDVLNIPFRKVTMIKTHLPWKNPVADALAYSKKATGAYRSDRSIISGTTTADRWIAPGDLIARMAERAHVEYGVAFDFTSFKKAIDERGAGGLPVVSTLPMATLMEALGYVPLPSETAPGHVPGINIRATIKDCDAYISLLVPDPDYQFSRISITGDELIVEFPNFRTSIAGKDTSSRSAIASMVKDEAYLAAQLIGIPRASLSDFTIHEQQYAKIVPMNETDRKAFMFWATDKFNIYSLGRYATWRPGLLLDDLVQDVRLIDRWIGVGRYSVARHR